MSTKGTPLEDYTQDFYRLARMLCKINFGIDHGSNPVIDLYHGMCQRHLLYLSTVIEENTGKVGRVD